MSTLVRVHIENLKVPITESMVESVVHAVCAGEGQELAIDVHLIDDDTSETLNQRHLQHEGPADVIAFGYPFEPGEPRQLGDVDGEVFVNLDMARREGAARLHGATSEALFYVAHGVLHLLGYDDATDEERLAMHRLQAHYLDAVGVPVTL